ncbi:UNVERIFIED_CONTAM: Iron-sulfur cluster assembly protein 1 [Sesamum angustifolium]|uniref:Iron-sulfur cluster assembly protein 1 n=1 Tax=Sesamum angustifolium TaxID=2727405 RepID=A0AAW2Q9X2_9LAMI
MLRHLTNTAVGRRLRSSAATGGAGLRRMYHERVVDHYNNPRNVGSFDKNDPSVGTGLVGAPACGDVMKLQIKVDEVKLLMLVLRLSAVVPRSPPPLLEIAISSLKLHCSMLAEDAIKAAVKDYEAKRFKDLQGQWLDAGVVKF